MTTELDKTLPSSVATATTVETTHTRQGPTSSVLAELESSTDTAPRVTFFSLGDPSVLPPTSDVFDTIKTPREPTSSLTMGLGTTSTIEGLRATSTSEGTSSAAEPSPGFSAYTEVSSEKVIFSGRATNPQPGEDTQSPDNTSGEISAFTSSLAMTQSVDVTPSIQACCSSATTPRTTRGDTSTWMGAPSNGTHGLSHLQATVLTNAGPENALRTHQASVDDVTADPSPLSAPTTSFVSTEDPASFSAVTPSLPTSGLTKTSNVVSASMDTASSPSPLLTTGRGPTSLAVVSGVASRSSVNDTTYGPAHRSSPAVTSSSPASSTSADSSPFSPLTTASLLTPGLTQTTEMNTTPPPETNLSLNPSSTSVDALPFSDVHTESDRSPPSLESAVTVVDTVSVGQEPVSSVLASPETTTATSQRVTDVPLGDTSIFPSTPAFFDTTKSHRGPTFSWTTGWRATSASEDGSSTAKTTGLSEGAVGATTEVTGTRTISAHQAHSTGPVQPPGSPRTPTGKSSGFPASPMAQSTLLGEKPTTNSRTGPRSAVTQSPFHLETTTFRSWKPEHASWTSTISVATTASEDARNSARHVTPVPVSTESSFSSPLTTSSLLTSGLMKNPDVMSDSRKTNVLNFRIDSKKYL
ncbi:mucin-16-like [Ochotona curzoniae]|uniref:mucin-16-like n=1 Tax=Ochotona curzoniae TaxID=130825 RepID=UPI001B3461AD|nr:mucin-16-like [Ochotona curzoniae]